MRIIWVIIIGFCCQLSHAQLHFNGTSGARSNGLAGFGTTLEGVDALFNNPAGIATNDQFSFIISSELRFQLADVTSVAAGISIPLQRFGTIGVSVSNLGLEEYKEQKIGLAYARALSSGLKIAGQIDLLNTTIVGFGNRFLATAELGIMADIAEKFKLGAHIFSPVKISVLDSDINSRLRFGGAYQPSDKVNIVLEVDKWFQNPLSVRAGFEYQLQEKIQVRIGASTRPAIYAIGLSYSLNDKLSFDGGFGAHQFLGSTPSITIKSNR